MISPGCRHVGVLVLACLSRVLLPIIVSHIAEPPGSGNPIKYSMQVGISLMLLNEWLNFAFLFALLRRDPLTGVRSVRTKLAIAVVSAVWFSTAAFSWFVQYPATISSVDVDRAWSVQTLQPLRK